MDKSVLKRIIIEYQNVASEISLKVRDFSFSTKGNDVLVGLRRSGKSYMMFQKIQQLINDGHKKEEILYINFEDDRLLGFDTQDFEVLKQSYEELFPYEPIFFLDEIQNVPNWEKFARRLADQKYKVYITGSNAKMLSGEIATTLGGRFFMHNIYPYSFKEYLNASNIAIPDNLDYQNNSEIIRTFAQYFTFGGMPELHDVPPIEKRLWLSSLYNKIFFGDLISRYSIRNDMALKVLVRKLADSVKQPTSFNRMANVVSSTGQKIKTDTVIEYLKYLEETWLIFSIENISSKLNDKVSNKKYYFIDNGILNLFLTDGNTSLFENMLAIHLRHHYAHELFYYLKDVEVDFYLYDSQIAIQACYNMSDISTRNREVGDLIKFAKVFPCKKLYIVTNDEEYEMEESGFKISVVPLWKFLILDCLKTKV